MLNILIYNTAVVTVGKVFFFVFFNDDNSISTFERCCQFIALHPSCTTVLVVKIVNSDQTAAVLVVCKFCTLITELIRWNALTSSHVEINPFGSHCNIWCIFTPLTLSSLSIKHILYLHNAVDGLCLYCGIYNHCWPKQCVSLLET